MKSCLQTNSVLLYETNLVKGSIKAKSMTNENKLFIRKYSINLSNSNKKEHWVEKMFNIKLAHFFYLAVPNYIKKVQENVKGKSGIYGLVCIVTQDFYIGSAEDLSVRFKGHCIGRKSNIHLQIPKYGISSFEFLIFEYYNSKVEDTFYTIFILENQYLNMIKPRYNIRKSATTMKGYQHSNEAINKMKEYLKQYLILC